jgi:Ran GTPase-activating protein (RanGAP) involved in mRNA processing and transport
MGNYNQVYYTDYRWIKQITEESNKAIEKNKEENLIYYIPLPLIQSYLIEQKLYEVQKKNIKDENFDLINQTYKENNQIYYRTKFPITDKLIFRKVRLNRNPFKPIALNRTNTLNELKIFYYENIFQDFEIDIEDAFIVKFCHHISLCHSKIIHLIEKNLINHLKNYHNLNNEVLTFAKLRNILVKDFIQCKEINLSPYTYYYVKNLTKDNFKKIITQIFIEEGDIYIIVNYIITQKKINLNCLWFLLCLIYVFDTEANQKEIITTYKTVDSINLEIFKEGTLITNKEYMSTSKNKNFFTNEKNIIEINYERILNKNWYLSFKAMDTEELSPYVKSQEVIIQPNSVFEVREVIKLKEDSYYISLYMKSNCLNDCILCNMSTQMKIDLGVCIDIQSDVKEMYPGLKLENVISLTISSKESLKKNLTNLASMKNLRVLDMREIGLDDNDMEEILPFFLNLTYLSYLNLSMNNLEYESMISLENIMDLIPFLEYINLNQNNLGDKGTDYFTKGLSHIRDLRSLNFIYNQVKCNSIEKLSLELVKYENLKMINFSNNYIYNDEMDNLVWAIGKMNNLTYLNLSNNQIGSEGIALLGEILPKSIQRLNFSENEITEDGFMYFSKFMNRIPYLKAFVIYGNKNGSNGMSCLLKGFKETPFLEYLNLGCNLLTNPDLLLITQNFDNLKNLKILNLRENNISSEGVIFLNDTINQLDKLTTLDLGWNDINEESLNPLIDSLKSMKDFISLNLDSNPISVVGLKNIMKELKNYDNSWNYSKGEIKRNPKYLTKEQLANNYIVQNKTSNAEILNLNGNGIEEEELFNEFKSLKNYEHVKNLIFTRQRLDENIIKGLSDNLKFIPHLLNIELGENEINDEGIKTLSEGLKNLIDLETIDLNSNNISSKGMESLSNNLKFLVNLKILNLNWNIISDEGLISLSKINLPSLEILLLKDNSIETEGMKNFSKKLSNYPNINHLELGWNDIGDVGLKEFSNNMKILKNLKNLMLSNTDITDDGFINFVNNIGNIPKLETLYFWNNQITDKGAEELLKNIYKCNKLRIIDLTINIIGEELRNQFRDYCEKNKGLFVDI